MTYDPHYHPHPSYRVPVYAKKGMVSTSQPLAAQAGLDILKKGGNAIDAAITTAASLTVLEPASNGIGGDAFALVWTNNQLYGLNASGPSPQSISIDALKEKGYRDIPKYGMIPVTVPGAPAAWAALSKRFGKLPLSQVLQPAIQYAKEGFPLAPTLAKQWKQAYDTFKRVHTSKEFESWFQTFAANGQAPKAGEMWSSIHHARTLQLIGETNAEAFYKGELADRIDAFSKKHGGFLSKEDLATFEPEWVNPISAHYRGYDVWEIPPNGQGLIALLALNIVKGFELLEKDAVDTYHKQIEAIKLAFADGEKYITEEAKMSVSVSELLSDTYASYRRGLIKEHALQPEAGEPVGSGTVYLATADEEGNMVSLIQSNYMGFGSGIVVPETGIALQNRGHNFSMDPNHDNCLAPNKKTFHTIIPGFLTKNNEPVGPFGVMGGFMQPQGHMQVVMNTIDFQLHPQAALDAPRWQWKKDKTVLVEPAFPSHVAQALERKGHKIEVAVDSMAFGRGQIIWRDPESGVLCGGSESRTDGFVAGW
ncbi:gamma-glutamyltransferase [Priestia megaterium]|uniref:gamma-glutamyltransferase family protein n=1 Tax=Priestia megaterium TaxID=1404 RepID=UPI000BF8FB34|nr:gamma-glutamyltransferase family protein [Priestia megaterium]MEB2293411.1 gamma-glutamyltransferase family protein [Priestia megaterium]PEZ09692.1 gamma-glutamyltransferase [Priestia megaterium]PGK27862.1 gamma-glutamyltransferase [Priestia megaterium]